METNKLYEMKYDSIYKAMTRQEGDYVPNLIFNNGGGFFWGGKTAFDYEGDPQGHAKALCSFLDEMWVDASGFSGLTTSPRRDRFFPTAENRLAADGTITHLQVSPMKADEYDQMAADLPAFMANVLLPRKYPYLFESKEKTRELLKVYAEETVCSIGGQFACTKQHMKETYGICSVLSRNTINTPLDDLFDYFRGFRGTLTDLRRHPDQVKVGLEAIWDYQDAPMVSRPYDAVSGCPFQPCHIPAYLSPKQFKEFYWPYEKKLIEWVASAGGKIYLIMEGSWKNIMDCFLEAPKDSLVLAVDDDDFLETYKLLGHHQIICGGLKLGDTRLKKFDDIKDDIKRVIDTCAPGGGFIFNTDKGFVTPGDVNATLIECYNFAHEYSKK